MSTGFRLPPIKLIFVAVAVLQILLFAFQISKHAPAMGGDTGDYQDVAARLLAGKFSVVWTDNRPPAYPLFLIVTQFLRLAPNVGAVIFNGLMAMLTALLLSETAALGLVTGYLVLTASSTVLSYENLIMTESIMPGMVLLGLTLGILAARQWRRAAYRNWIVLLVGQTFLLSSLKPGFKYVGVASIMLSILGLALKHRRPTRAQIFSLALGATLVVMSGNFLFAGSGKAALMNNKALAIVNAPPLKLFPGEYESWPSRVQKSYDAFERHWASAPKNYNGTVLSYEEGAEVFDHLYWRHLDAFLTRDAVAAVKLFYYSTWNNDVGQLNRSIGIPFGYGSLGLLVTSLLIGLTLALLRKHRWVHLSGDDVDEWLALRETGLFFIYGLAVEILVNCTDYDRLSLPWFLPYYSFLVILWSRMFLATILKETYEPVVVH